MSRREERSSDSKRHRSRFDRELSPKRSRRDGIPETERPPTEADWRKNRLDQDDKHNRQLQDPLSLEAPLAHDSKVENMGKESERRSNDDERGPIHFSDATKVPQFRSHFQHDDRGRVGQKGRSSVRRTDGGRRWWRDPKEPQSDRRVYKTVTSDTYRKNERPRDTEHSHVWHHDKYLEMRSNPRPTERGRPAFREQKVPADPEKPKETAASDPVMPNTHDITVESGRRDERGHNSSRHSDRQFAGEREMNQAQTWRGNFSSRDRPGASSRYRGRDSFTARQGYRPTGGHVEKWKHDLYDEANRSPNQKNEEDQISKIEALLAS